MTDANTDDANKNDDDDSKATNGVAPTLDQVHAMNQAKLEEEEEQNADDNTDEDDGDGSADGDDTDDSDSDDAGSDDGDGDDDAPPAPDDDDNEEPVKPAEPAPQLDTDTTKPGDGKVAVKDFEGKTHYFNNLDEIPNDFEPESYKETIRAGKEFAKKEASDEAAAASKAEADAQAAETAETKARTEAMQKSWDADIQTLTSSGLFPKDKTKNQAAANEVYDYIEAEMKKNNVITSFNQAYKSMMYDKQQAKDAKDQKTINDKKKERGGVVQPGSGGNAAAPTSVRGGKVLPGIPQGASLDMIHADQISKI